MRMLASSRRVTLVLVSLIAAAVLTAEAAVANVVTLNLQISNRDDDYKESQTSGASTRLDETQDLWIAADFKQAFRFVNVAIPRGAPILDARLQVYSPATGTDNALDGIAQGQAVGNAPAWTGVTNEITNAAKTAAQVTITNLPPWTPDAHNDVADVGQIVQELVNRGDWNSGNALKIFLIGTSTASHRRTKTYDSAASRGAKLIVHYVATAPCGSASVIEMTPTSGTLRALDIGWTGAGHDGSVSTQNASLTFLTQCNDASAPCTDCDLTDVIRNLNADAGGIHNQRCTHNTAVKCTSDAQCAALQAGSTCRLYFGSPLPVAGSFFELSIVACASTYVNGPVSGNVDPLNGDAVVAVPLATRLTDFTASDVANACPRCVGDATPNDGVRGGTCTTGTNHGLACDGNAVSYATFGTTSLDCPPAGGILTASVLNGATMTDTRTLSTANPACTGAPGLRCFCSTCNNGDATPCFTDADCPQNPPGTPGICGGKRCFNGTNPGAPCASDANCTGGGFCGVPGEQPKPNACSDSTCTPTTGGDGECANGPIESFCGPSSPPRFKPCTSNADCASLGVCSENANKACTSNAGCTGTCIKDTCQSKARQCYTDNGQIGGSVSAIGVVTTVPSGGQWDAKLASLSCAGYAPLSLTNSTVGLPGLARVELPVHLRSIP